ncbi:MAG: undecaprenyl-diphosphate phosphatase [Burkholderiales bacterium]|jgi:undecaprenyl-diphosphatase|nr:undecaprenyl-diphosphate phosphatase [Burkholderiales bacterium]
MDFLFAVFLGIVEGITEFLPISSTGHLIVAGAPFGYTADNYATFFISIQLGAILAVCWEYRARLIHVALTLHTSSASRRLIVNLLVAMLPASIVGVLLKETLEHYLFAPVPVACALIVGAIVIFIAEKRYRRSANAVRIQSTDDIRWTDALKVGLAQVFALIPGTSRSGSTIIGAMLFGFSRVAATEFSFFLAIPVMFAATFYSLWKDGKMLSSLHDSLFLAVGFVFAFISAFFCVRWLLRYISCHDFIPFAWYRIGFGVFILVTWYANVIVWQ